MLQLVLGRSGSGKTQWIYERLSALVDTEEDRPLLCVVPEQFSFETERSLLEALGPHRAARIQVLSFTRMAETVFRSTGGFAGRRLDDSSRMLLMSRALEMTAGQLSLYTRHTADPEYISSMLSMLSELKQCAVTPLALEKTAKALPKGTLAMKAQELSLIYGAYEALLGHTYLDPLDDLTRLAEVLPESGLLKGALLFVDAFKGFTAQEMQVLSALLNMADTVTVTLCTDTLDDTAQGLGRFSPVIRTGLRLEQLAQRQHIPVAKPVVLLENRRSRSEALLRLEEESFLPDGSPLETPADDVTLTACADIYAECTFTARTIRRLLREEDARCRDFAVVTRNLDEYRGILDAALEMEGIPYFLDTREDILTEPLVSITLCALRCAAGWDTELLLRLMKTGLAGFSAHSISQLENYVLMWRIHGIGWTRDWEGNPDGLDAPFTEETAKKLDSLNRLRRRLIRPLEHLRYTLYPRSTAASPEDAADRLTGRDFAAAVYRYLTETRAARMVRLQVARLDRDGEHALADRYARLWDMLIDRLDAFAAAMGGDRLPADRLTELFRLSLQAADLGSIPQSLDAVQIGAADRMRFSAPRTVFILGANEGIFPAYPAQGGLLSDRERQQLIELGLPLAEPSEQQTVEERFFAYMALSAPSERLYVSYRCSNAAGETLTPSLLAETVSRLLPNCRRLTVPTEEENSLGGIESHTDAFGRMAELWHAETAVAASLKAFFSAQPEMRSRIDALERAADDKPIAFRDPQTARQLFGREMRISSSQIEQYHKCRFAYFCQYGLHIKAARPAELDSLAFGTLAHYVMSSLLPQYVKAGLDGLTQAKVRTDTRRTVEQYVEERMGGLDNKPARFRHLLEQLLRTSSSLLWYVVQELRQSRFVPADYELNIGIPPQEDEAYVPPVVLTLPDGARICVQGKVDRVDVFRDGVHNYVRVIDYKTSDKAFHLSDVVEGLNVQMLIYLFSLWENGGTRYGEVTPAGVLYLPAKSPVAAISPLADEAQAAGIRLKELKMNGLLIDDPAVVSAMEQEAAGVFIPAKLTAKGEFDSRSSSLASLAQFGQLKKRMEKLLTAMAESLRGGRIEAKPVKSKEKTACQYCPYRSICGHDDDGPARLLISRKNSEIFQELEKDETSAGASD